MPKAKKYKIKVKEALAGAEKGIKRTYGKIVSPSNKKKVKHAVSVAGKYTKKTVHKIADKIKHIHFETGGDIKVQQEDGAPQEEPLFSYRGVKNLKGQYFQNLTRQEAINRVLTDVFGAVWAEHPTSTIDSVINGLEFAMSRPDFDKYKSNKNIVAAFEREIAHFKKIKSEGYNTIIEYAEAKLKHNSEREYAVGGYLKKNEKLKVTAFTEEDDDGDMVVRIDYIEVPKAERFGGKGKDEVLNIIKWAKNIGAKNIVIESKRSAIPFWKKMGFDILDQGSSVSTGFLELKNGGIVAEDELLSDIKHINLLKQKRNRMKVGSANMDSIQKEITSLQDKYDNKRVARGMAPIFADGGEVDGENIVLKEDGTWFQINKEEEARLEKEKNWQDSLTWQAQHEYNPQFEDGGTVAPANDPERDKEIAKNILIQLGGRAKLNMMTGAYDFYAVPSGVVFKIKNKKANFIRITLNAKDLYNISIGRIHGSSFKIIVEANDLYDDMLIPVIEKYTGMFLSF